MKNASPGLTALLNSSLIFIMADLWTFTLKNGVILRYTNYDINLAVGSDVFSSRDVLVTGGNLKQTRGLQVNETDVTCDPNLGANGESPSVVGSTPFLRAVSESMFNRAAVSRDRVFMPTPGDTSLGTINIFLGEISDVAVTRNQAILKAKDATNLLNIYMPRRQYQPTCAWVFGDANCGFDRSSLAVSSSVGNASSGSTIYCTLTDASGKYNNGTVKFTSGVNNELTRSVKNYAPGIITLVAPFPNQAAVADTFTITPGCNKTFTGQSQSYTGSATTGSTTARILIDNAASAGTYNGFYLKATSGGNSGSMSQILTWVPNLVTLVTPFSLQPDVGDTYQIGTFDGTTFTPVDSAACVSGIRVNQIPTNLTNADGTFNGGTILGTSGVNVGITLTISIWTNGSAQLANPFPNVPNVGDTFNLTTSVGSTQSTCTGYWGSDADLHFGGQPFVPVPETAY